MLEDWATAQTDR